MSSPQMMPDSSQLAALFWGLAESRATSRQFRFSPESEIELRRFFEQGVKTLLAQKQSPQSAVLAKAKDDIERLVDKMIEYGVQEHRAAKDKQKAAQSTDDLIWEAGGFVFLHESTLRKARDWFCPCFPFC